MDELATDVKRHVIDRLEQFVRTETPSGDADALGRFADMFGARLASLGAEIRIVASDGGPHLIAELPGRGDYASRRPVLLVGHADTVWPRGTIDGAMPWNNEGGLIAGPGTFDMKAGLAVIEAGLAHDLEHCPPVKVFVAADEEIGSPTSASHLLRAAEGCSLAVGFESPHADGALKVGRLGSTRIRIEVTGREAHAALDPDGGSSATDELVDHLQVIRAMTDDIARSHPGQILRNLGGIDAPGRTNVVSSYAAALLGFRFGNPDVERETLGRIASLTAIREGCEISPVTLSRRPTWIATPKDEAVVAHLQTLEPSVKARPAAGAADTNALGCTALPVIDGFGPRGGGAHARSEHILVESLWQRVALLRKFLRVPFADCPTLD